MSKHLKTPEKIRLFEKYWPELRASIKREQFATRDEYRSEILHQRYRLWCRVDRELGFSYQRKALNLSEG